MTIGFLGLGEVGSSYATGLSEEQVTLKGYDVFLNSPGYDGRFARLADHGITLCASVEELVSGCDIVVAVTTSHVAVETARSVQPYLKAGQIYVELNSATPAVKEEVRQVLAGIDVVDGATMGSPLIHQHKTLILLSGEKGSYITDTLNGYGMNIRFIGSVFGQASGIKIVRSIFMKGVEAVLMESMQAACHLDIQDKVWESICEFFEAAPAEQSLSTMLRSNAIHAKRRGEEVGGALDLLREMNLDDTMTQASTQKLLWIGNSGIREQFNGYVPQEMDAVLAALPKKD